MIPRDWLTRNAEALGAQDALATAFAALTALVVISCQVGQADGSQRDQTAPEWHLPMASYLADHMSYLCSQGIWDAQSPDIKDLVAEVALTCETQHQCRWCG